MSQYAVIFNSSFTGTDAWYMTGKLIKVDNGDVILSRSMQCDISPGGEKEADGLFRQGILESIHDTLLEAAKVVMQGSRIK